MPFTTSLVTNVAGPNPAALIAQERASAQFDPTDMYKVVEGTPEKAAKILDLYQLLERDPVIAPTFQDYELSRDENRAQTAKRIGRMSQYVELEPYKDFWRRLNLVTMYDPSLGIRISVNLGLFMHCVKGNGTAAQFNYWAVDKEAKYMKHIWGCFAMTELGHGSNVAGVETTATFDKIKDEFIINTPHVGATKWWIGGAAHSATHASVYARLRVDGKDYGVKTFVVPLRDSNHNLMPGVSIGDIGSKMGREGVDNGWIQFSNVRIPRFFMLQKFCQVSREGKVTLPPLEQLSYISLLQGRVGMASDSYRICARFVTIAVRYAVGRRQFKGDAVKAPGETQLINYPLHQRRLMPYLALTYAAALGTDRLEREHDHIVESFDDALATKNEKAIFQSVENTKSLFVDSAALKATLTWLAEQCITETRQSCGGQGYSAYSGFGKAYDDWVVQCTWEGDNNVLGMSAGKTVMKNVQSVINKNVKIKGSLQFLTNAKEFGSSGVLLNNTEDLTPQKVLRALEVLMVKIAIAALAKIKESGSWDAVSYEKVLLAKLLCHHYLLEVFIDTIAGVSKPDLLFALAKIQKLYYLNFILDGFSKDFVGHEVMSAKLAMEINSNLIPQMCFEVRTQAIPLTDSFQIPDVLLNSAIGGYDGNFYENYFKVVKANNDCSNTKAPYSSELESVLRRTSVEERERGEKNSESAGKLMQ